MSIDRQGRRPGGGARGGFRERRGGRFFFEKKSSRGEGRRVSRIFLRAGHRGRRVGARVTGQTHKRFPGSVRRVRRRSGVLPREPYPESRGVRGDEATRRTRGARDRRRRERRRAHHRGARRGRDQRQGRPSRGDGGGLLHRQLSWTITANARSRPTQRKKKRRGCALRVLQILCVRDGQRVVRVWQRVFGATRVSHRGHRDVQRAVDVVPHHRARGVRPGRAR